jgi:hypothetical protein
MEIQDWHTMPTVTPAKTPTTHRLSGLDPVRKYDALKTATPLVPPHMTPLKALVDRAVAVGVALPYSNC